MAVHKITLRWRYRRLITKIISISVIGYLLACIIGENISKICQKDQWRFSFGISTIIYILLLFLILFFVFIKGKRTRYFVFPIEQKVRKKKKEIMYSKIAVSQSVVQKAFGLMDCKFIDKNLLTKVNSFL